MPTKECLGCGNQVPITGKFCPDCFEYKLRLDKQQDRKDSRGNLCSLCDNPSLVQIAGEYTCKEHLELKIAILEVLKAKQIKELSQTIHEIKLYSDLLTPPKSNTKIEYLCSCGFSSQYSLDLHSHIGANMGDKLQAHFPSGEKHNGKLIFRDTKIIGDPIKPPARPVKAVDTDDLW